MPDDLLAEAREFWINRDARLDADENVAIFARTAIASAVKADRERIADELQEQFYVMMTGDGDWLENFIAELRGENNGQ